MGKPEKDVLKEYRSGGGTKKLYDFVKNKLSNPDKEKIETLNSLIKYYRDASAHGESPQILEFNAYDSLSRLIRLCYHFKECVQWGNEFVLLPIEHAKPFCSRVKKVVRPTALMEQDLLGTHCMRLLLNHHFRGRRLPGGR